DRQRDEVEIRQLIGQHRDGAGQHRNRFELAVAQVNEMTAKGLLAHAGDDFGERWLGNLVKRLADPAGEVEPTQHEFFRGSQGQHDGSLRGDGPRVVRYYLTVTGRLQWPLRRGEPCRAARMSSP